jgi:Mycothiol maleylpyruvate isomerase N-terminal domain
VTPPRDLLRDEDAGWSDLMDVLGRFAPEQLEAPGYSAEGWSAKDLLAHVACWQAKTVQVLEQIRWGTRGEERVDTDELNARFFEWTHDLPVWVVRVMAWSSRSCMLLAWSELPEMTGDAEEWFRESGPEHYAEHLPRLREWVLEVASTT